MITQYISCCISIIIFGTVWEKVSECLVKQFWNGFFIKFPLKIQFRVTEKCKENCMDSKNLAICWWPTLLQVLYYFVLKISFSFFNSSVRVWGPDQVRDHEAPPGGRGPNSDRPVPVSFLRPGRSYDGVAMMS